LGVREFTRENEHISRLEQNFGQGIYRIGDAIHSCYGVSRWPGVVSVFPGLSTKFEDEKKLEQMDVVHALYHSQASRGVFAP
jgi:hypothetical protein